MLYENYNKKNADKPKILAHPHNANQIIFMNIEVYKILQKKYGPTIRNYRTIDPYLVNYPTYSTIKQ